MTVAVAGLVCVDLAPRLPGAPVCVPGSLTEVGELAISAGGCVGNTGADLADMGLPVRLVADIGADELGAVLIELLQAHGCDVTGLRTVPGRATSYSVVLQPPDTDRSFWHHVGSNADFDGASVDVSDVDLLHVGYPTILPALANDGGRRMLELFGRARDVGATTSLDLASLDPGGALAAIDWRAWLSAVLPLTDVCTPSVDDLKGTLVGFEDDVEPAAAAEELLGLGAAVALVTAGPDGLYLATADAARLRAAGSALSPLADVWADVRLHIAAAEVPVVTTNGAGDAAAAGFLYAIATAASPHDALRLAAAAAGHRVSGATRLPAYEGISEFCTPVQVAPVHELGEPSRRQIMGVA